MDDLADNVAVTIGVQAVLMALMGELQKSGVISGDQARSVIENAAEALARTGGPVEALAEKRLRKAFGLSAGD